MNTKEIEQRWQQYWEENQTFKTDVWDFTKPKFYALDMFPYPSGQGLHVGHPEGYTATDIVCRMKRMQGYNVLHPMGFDSFGLPAEQYAIKTGNHPEGFTLKNIETFTRQLKMLGFSFDWDRQVSTCDPKYYKWTQWIFKKLYEDGLAKYIDMPVNWCEELGTVLANDEIIDGKSERGGYPVVQKNMKQWVIDIPKYAERLIEGLDNIDWPESTKEMQRNWIGKSVGAQVDFKVADTNYSFTVFTTRCDTLFGATYCVLSPEHDLINKITTLSQKEEVLKYKSICAAKSELERTELNKEKTGVFTGAYAVNPVNNKLIPIWIADYVLATYGTGAIMAVPAHDERDYAFAKKFNLPIIPVIEKITGKKREDETFKKSIVALVYNPKTDKYLTLNWKEKGGRLLIGGTIKDDEDIITCAKREVEEETGYIDLKYIGESFSINHHYFAFNKNKAFEIEATGVFFELLSENKNECNQDEDEVNNYDVEWVSKDILKEIKDELHATVLENYINPSAYTEDGKMINSEFLNGLNKNEAINKMISFLEEKKIGKKVTNYRLREWIFARQRYWGEPIPIIHLEDGSIKALEDSELPLILPELNDYSPNKNGVSPLEKAPAWVNVVVDGKKGRRETSTMPGSAGSSWYFLRYIDPKNDKEIADKKLLEHWMPVDLYVGGPEHSVGHLLYSRMWNNYLYDKGVVPVKEPFVKLRHQGMILGSNGEKMSKSKGNVINPDDVINKYGSDTLRLYEMFMGPIEASKPWDDNMIDGSRRFLDRVWRVYVDENKIKDEMNINLEKVYHQTVKKVTDDYETMNFNTAISQMMIFINAVYKESVFPKEYAGNFIKLLNPIAPHMTEEIWSKVFKHNNTIAYESWPKYDESKLVLDETELVVQVNGKVRAKIMIDANLDDDKIKEIAISQENVKRYIENMEIIKMIVVNKRIVSIVVK